MESFKPTSFKDALLCADPMEIVSSPTSTSAPRLPETGVDVIASVDILKKIWMTPYSKSSLSIAVHRLGQTIVLSEPEEKPTVKNMIQKYADSLHLSDPTQVTPLTWLEAWLDNVMANVPELAFSCHDKSVVQGYELLSAADLSGETPAFDPQVAQQNGIAVLRYLLSNCKEDPGVYWLYKSAGEGKISLFDLSTASKKPPLGESPLPLVVRACAHEQFARLILNNEEELDLTSESNNVQGTGLDIGSVCQDPAPLLQTTTTRISSKLAAVHHVSQAIKSTQKLQGDIRQWLRTSKLDKKVWNLILLLGESYLSLGQAYKDNGQFPQALDTVKLACSTYGSMPHKYEETLFVSTLYTSFSLQSKSFPMQSESFSVIEDLKGACDVSLREELSSRRLFWAKVWLLVGEVYVFEYESKQVHGKSTNQGEKQNLSPLELPSEVAEEVERLEKKLAPSDRCGSCALFNCNCVAHIRKAKAKKLTDKARGGIFKYVNKSKKDDAESNLRAALYCFEETERALEKVTRGCNELQGVVRRKMWVWNEVGRIHLSSKNLKKAEDAYANAIEACRKMSDYASMILIIVNMAFTRRNLAEEMVLKMESKRNNKARKEAVGTTISEYCCSLRFYLEAKKEIDLAIEKSILIPEELKSKVYTELGMTYVLLGRILVKEDTTVPAALLSDHSSVDPLSASDLIQKTKSLYKSLGEVRNKYTGAAYRQLALYLYEQCCLRRREGSAPSLEEANQYALMADAMWDTSMGRYGPENYPSEFVEVLIERTDLSLSLPRQANTVLESALSRFLEGRHISKEDELSKKFWTQLQKILKQMLAFSVVAGESKTVKLKKLYLTSLKPTSQSTSDLNAMHLTWTSEA
ncbi:unnamed protein product [Arabis nemorensis]|uniref:EDRF1 N-terminal domain-containing protein n=1 Tax=Arabis nemorensis TaxID=586526 RepID=A0A565ASA0_9BRAS|nr:unnamed protein product [Arabis nemorensis]